MYGKLPIRKSCWQKVTVKIFVTTILAILICAAQWKLKKLLKTWTENQAQLQNFDGHFIDIFSRHLNFESHKPQTWSS